QARPEKHLWADSFERDLRDVLALQSDVARVIVREIKTATTSQEEARFAKARPVNAEAYEAYLKGRYFWNQRTERGLKKGLDCFRQAVEKEPTYALAFVGLADSYNLLNDYGVLPAKQCMPKAKAAAMKALEIEEQLAEAHNSLAFARMVYDY